MHESIVTLQQLIDEDRAAVRAMTEELDRAAASGVTLMNRLYLEVQIHTRSKRAEEHAGLVRDCTDAIERGLSSESARALVLIQFTAATMIEQRNAEAAHGLD
ncbi:hypothetical protein OHA25_60400 (plasmid) [Nonomuraea sp. NBC_00507]|uniref:hypothetical protein n=1 Tax=Nonomuraea sp. NBC_00507 TaxID=2976002 RepID=UPI002E170C32